MSVITDIADDIVTAIKAGTYEVEDVETLIPERVEVINEEGFEADRLIVKVVPLATEIVNRNRSATQKIHVIQIAVIKKVGTAENVDFDRYSRFVEQLVEDTLTRLASTTQTSASWMSITLPVTHSPKALRENGLFWAVIETRYKMAN